MGCSHAADWPSARHAAQKRRPEDTDRHPRGLKVRYNTRLVCVVQAADHLSRVDKKQSFSDKVAAVNDLLAADDKDEGGK